MGLLDMFGGSKKKAAEEEAEALRVQNSHDEKVAAQKEAHKDLTWPTVGRLNLLQPRDEEAVRGDDPISPERKEEVGNLVFEPEIKPEDVFDLTLPELLFLLETQAFYNHRAPLENYESNRRTMYNDFLRRIHQAERLYVLYDRKTRYPLVDGGYAVIYLDLEHAKKAVELYRTQFRDLEVHTVPGEAFVQPENGPKQGSLFDYLFYIGMENVVVDNGWYKGIVKRSEISAPPTFNLDPSKVPPCAPDLSFTMIDYLGERKWPVTYERREEVIKRKEDRMYAQMKKTLFLIPVQITNKPGEAEQPSPEHPLGNKEIHVAMLKASQKSGEGEEKNLLPVYTDFIEYSKTAFARGGLKPLGFKFENLEGFLANTDGMIINSEGQGLIVSTTKILSMIHGEETTTQQ